MELVRRLDPRPLGAARAVQLLVVVLLLGAMTFGAAQAAHWVTHEGRCGDLLANEQPSDYIGFEVEGCGVR